jgi:hypothetical protein
MAKNLLDDLEIKMDIPKSNVLIYHIPKTDRTL